MHPILFLNGFLRCRPDGSATDMPLPKKDGRFRRWIRYHWERWMHRKIIATLNALDDHTLEAIGIQHRHIKRFADSLCGVDSRVLAATAAPSERHHGQSRLMRTP